MFVLSIVLTSLFSLFYVTRERNRFLHRGYAMSPLQSNITNRLPSQYFPRQASLQKQLKAFNASVNLHDPPFKQPVS